MSKICSYCSKKLPKEAEEWRLMHERCFTMYKDETKTPDSYIFMTGKYAGKKYADVKEKHTKYIDWVINKADPADDSPLYFLKMYCEKFKKQEEQPKKSKKRTHEENRKKDNDELSVYGSSDEEENI